MQSVASINSPDLLPAPASAPERKDKGDDSFSNMLAAQDAAAQPVSVSMQFTGTVTGVDLSGSQPLL